MPGVSGLVEIELTPKECSFFIEKDPSLAGQMARLALRHGEPLWRDLMDQGLAQAIRTQTGTRRDLLDALIEVPNKNDAKQALETILEDMKKPQRMKLVQSVRSGETVGGRGGGRDGTR